jgi:hypothetical protein
MNLSPNDITKIEQAITRVIDKKFVGLENLIKNITRDTETNKLLALQQLYLRKRVLTIKEVTEAKLIGDYTAKTVLAKLKHNQGCFKDGKIYRILTDSIKQYRCCYSIQ